MEPVWSNSFCLLVPPSLKGPHFTGLPHCSTLSLPSLLSSTLAFFWTEMALHRDLWRHRRQSWTCPLGASGTPPPLLQPGHLRHAAKCPLGGQVDPSPNHSWYGFKHWLCHKTVQEGWVKSRGWTFPVSMSLVFSLHLKVTPWGGGPRVEILWKSFMCPSYRGWWMNTKSCKWCSTKVKGLRYFLG